MTAAPGTGATGGLALLHDHVPLMALLAALLSAFLSLLWRERAGERRRLFVRLFALLFGGALAAGWLMSAVGR